jgi:anti-sigma-K factor RskA
MIGAAVLTGWYVGFAIGALAIVLVVALVAMILNLARRIGMQALAITEALEESRDNTAPLWDVEKVNVGLRSIVKSARQAREVLEGAR